MSAAAHADNKPLIIGRYALFDVLASGGMATVHLGRLLGREGFGRTVAVKRLHSHFTTDPEFVTMFTDEARIVARIRHPNVVPMVDVIEAPQGLFLVMEYIHGETFSRLLRAAREAKQMVPVEVATSIMHGVLLGLHAAHETRGPTNELLDVVHRDVSPQNIIVGADGVARVLDFGVAKAAGRAQVTREGQVKGKLAYMAPEQIRGKVDRRADVFACGVCLWEALAGRRLHEGQRDVEIVTRIMQGTFPRPSEERPDVSPELDEIVMKSLAADPNKRYANAREMALEIERVVALAPPSTVGSWVERHAPEALSARTEHINAMEQVAATLAPAASVPPPAPDPADANLASYDTAQGGDLSATGATPIGHEVPAEPRSAGGRISVTAALAVLIVLALVGIGLMAIALRHRINAAPVVATSSSGAAAPVVPPPSARPAVSAARPPLVVDAGIATTGSSASRPFSSPAPTVSASSQKKKCDPVAIDAQGHRKYNLECIDQ